MLDEKYFDPVKIIIRRIERQTAKSFIEKYHYTHSVSLCRVAYGVFYLTDKIDKFFNYETEEKLIGAVLFSQPCGRSAAASVSDLIKIEECLELIRLVILDGYGKNIESYVISQSMKLLKKEFPHIKIIISYADDEQGHKGIIYQAANFYYRGDNSNTRLMPSYSISLVGPPHEYKWIHSRNIYSQYGSSNVEHLKNKISHTFYRKCESNKHRYIYFLCNKKEKRLILKNLKHPFLPYPKISTHTDKIEKIEVNNTATENQFFG